MYDDDDNANAVQSAATVAIFKSSPLLSGGVLCDIAGFIVTVMAMTPAIKKVMRKAH